MVLGDFNLLSSFRQSQNQNLEDMTLIVCKYTKESVSFTCRRPAARPCHHGLLNVGARLITPCSVERTAARGVRPKDSDADSAAALPS